MKRRKRCTPSKHEDRKIRGSKHVKCVNCGDVFPCRKPCSHLDCLWELGMPMPDWVRLHEA